MCRCSVRHAGLGPRLLCEGDVSEGQGVKGGSSKEGMHHMKHAMAGMDDDTMDLYCGTGAVLCCPAVRNERALSDTVGYHLPT